MKAMNFDCVQCDTKFNELYSKQTQCDKSYGRQEALSRHINSGHAVEGYICDECDQRFSRQDVLSRHNESVHC